MPLPTSTKMIMTITTTMDYDVIGYICKWLCLVTNVNSLLMLHMMDNDVNKKYNITIENKKNLHMKECKCYI